MALLEGWTAYYWVGLKIYQVSLLEHWDDFELISQFLPVFLGLGVVTAYVGKVALGDMRVQRLKAGGKP